MEEFHNFNLGVLISKKLKNRDDNCTTEIIRLDPAEALANIFQSPLKYCCEIEKLFKQLESIELFIF